MSGAVREMCAYGGRSCYVCGELGHIARDCCRRAVVGGSGPFCCFVCGKPGHLARYCHKRARPKCSSGGGRSRAVDKEQEQGHLSPNSDPTSVGVTREPESLAPSSSQRVGAIAIGTSYSSSSDDDDEEEEEEKRVVVESMSNVVFSSSFQNCRLLRLAAFELSTDDDDGDRDGVVSKKSTGSLNATVRREEEKYDDEDDDDDCVILDYDPFQPPTVDYQNKFSRADRYLSVLRNKDIPVVAEQGQLALSSGDPIRKEISSFSSNEDDDYYDYDDDDDDDDDEEEEEEVVSKKSTGFLNVVRVKEEKMREEDWEDDDSCIILDFDPFQPPTADFENKLSLSDRHPSGLQNEDIFVISERGQVACRDYPHSRHHCARYPFSNSDHESCCPQCYCYVCDVVAPCEQWKGSNGHCHASNDDSTWTAHRMLHRLDDICG